MSSSHYPAAVVDESNAKMAVREWVGWEEIVLEGGDGEERKVCYFLLYAPPQDGGKSERDLAVVGKYWGPGNIAYSADLQFLQSLRTSLESGSASARVVTLVLEITQIRWKSRKEVMDWLTSLVSDPPYGAFGLTCPDYHDGASKDTPSTLSTAGENKEGFTWICKLRHLDQRRKHYKSFCREGMRISVHDFVFIKSGGRESHVAYVEDMYEDGSAKNMVLVRWFEEPDGEHGVALPPDLYCREIFFGYGLQDLRVEFVEGVAAVLNPQHFEMFKKINGGSSSWQPYVCRRCIDDGTVEPFDIAQLQGYANQEIVKEIVAASSSTVVQAKPPNNNGKASITGLAAKNHVGSSSTVTGDKTMDTQKQKPPPCSVTPSSVVIGGKTMEKQKEKAPACSTTPSSSGSVINDKTMEKQKPPPCSATTSTSSTVIDDNKTMEKQKEMPPPCSTTPSNSSSVINDKNMEKQKPPPCSAIASTSSTVIDDNKTMEKQKEMPPPCSATPQSTTIGQIVKSSVVPRSVVNCQTIAHNQPPPSGTSTCNVAVNDASTMLNPEKMFQPGCRLEALSQDSSVRGCWFKCVVLSRREKDNKVRVRYQDILNSEGKGQLRESLKVARIAEPDHLSIRLTKRPMLRPHLPRHYRKIESPVAVGVIVDARLKGGWWEGIVLQQETAGHVQVYLQGEGRLVELQVECLRKSFEWHEEQWIPLDARKDVAAKITLDLKGGERSSKQKAQKMDEQSSQTAAAAAAELAAPTAELVQPLEEGDDEPANSAPPRKRFLAQGYSFEEKRLEEHAKKIKGTANEAAKPVAAEGDGMSHGGSSADAKRCWVDPANSDGLNCAEREGKAAKSSGVKKMGSMEGSGSQGGASGGAAPVKPVPREEICVTNAEAPAVAMDKSEVIDLTLDD
ncbi:hypothetical protein CFC21_065820 [Triticum aestivum]|uniref:BAH domain-containing protein n=2 Tax=Triticum aestivum TaxID=4565 RepID=A0A9R1H3R8_WHEAT|nr:uncharacterized protein LOC123107035 [Triticum aestivum]KAF7058842.1 hypothetical protein CFC21_065820 [Triticum aestivum]